jgi:hypothetical protein
MYYHDYLTILYQTISISEVSMRLKSDFDISVGRDSSVGIATRFELDGQGIESRWRRDIPQPSRPALGPTQPPTE